MGQPAMKMDSETKMTQNIGRLESDVSHIQSDVTEIKVDIRRLDSKIERLNEKVDGVKDSLLAKVDEVRSTIDEVKGSVASLDVRMERSYSDIKTSIASAKLWAFGLYMALAAGLFTVLARGFKWI